MKNIVTVCSAMVLCLVMVNSASAQACCGSKAKAKVDKATAKVEAVTGKSIDVSEKDLKIVILCGKCGEEKGTKKCCAKDAVKCKKCGLNKGAPGCCKMDGSGKNMVQCPKTGKLAACPLKSGKCDAKAIKAACAAGKTSCGVTKDSAPKVPGK